jgi:ubiquitin-conjugating enzyme E2 Z
MINDDGKDDSSAIADSNVWDPYLNMKNRSPTPQCLKRIRSDVRYLNKEPLLGIYCVPDEDYSTVLHALIVGPFDTPYEGGFFYFLIDCPDTYPHVPPKVTLMTTGGGRVRFNPNLYANGKVCLSILGTWSGPGWAPVLSLASVLLSIQSLMNEKPYHNEPGYEGINIVDCNNYLECIRHETIRVAVCEMATAEVGLPEKLKPIIHNLFLSFFETYELTCSSNLSKSGQVLFDYLSLAHDASLYILIICRYANFNAQSVPETFLRHSTQPANDRSLP